MAGARLHKTYFLARSLIGFILARDSPPKQTINSEMEHQGRDTCGIEARLFAGWFGRPGLCVREPQKLHLN
jgi:hypothetical protein